MLFRRERVCFFQNEDPSGSGLIIRYCHGRGELTGPARSRRIIYLADVTRNEQDLNMVFQHLFSERMNRVVRAVHPWRTVHERRNAMSFHLILISALLGTLGASVPARGADYPTKTV